jgi:hypothetical protein
MNKIKSFWHRLKTGLMSSAIRAQNPDLFMQPDESNTLVADEVESLPVIEPVEQEDEAEKTSPAKVDGAAKKKPGRPKGTTSSKKVSD